MLTTGVNLVKFEVVKERVGHLSHSAVEDSCLEAVIGTNISDSDTQKHN